MYTRDALQTEILKIKGKLGAKLTKTPMAITRNNINISTERPTQTHKKRKIVKVTDTKIIFTFFLCHLPTSTIVILYLSLAITILTSDISDDFSTYFQCESLTSLMRYKNKFECSNKHKRATDHALKLDE